MTTMNISLPDQLKQHIDHRVTSGGYSSSSEYIRELVRKDQEQSAKQELAGLIREGLESGESIPVDDQYWKSKKAHLLSAEL